MQCLERGPARQGTSSDTSILAQHSMPAVPMLAVAQSPGSSPPIQMLGTQTRSWGANHSALASTNRAVPRPLHASQVFNVLCGTRPMPRSLIRSSPRAQTAASSRHVRKRDKVAVRLRREGADRVRAGGARQGASQGARSCFLP